MRRHTGEQHAPAPDRGRAKYRAELVRRGHQQAAPGSVGVVETGYEPDRDPERHHQRDHHTSSITGDRPTMTFTA